LEAENVELKNQLKKEGITEAKELGIRAQITVNMTALAALYAAANPAPCNIHLRWHFILYLLCFEFLFTCSRLIHPAIILDIIHPAFVYLAQIITDIPVSIFSLVQFIYCTICNMLTD
jgi:hypothetical protein